MTELPVMACPFSALPCEWRLLDHFILVALQVVSVAEACGLIHVPGHFCLISKWWWLEVNG